MRFVATFVLPLLLLFPGLAEAVQNERKLGVGIIVGEPTGLSLQAPTAKGLAINGILAYSIHHWVQMSADVVYATPKGFDEIFRTNSGIDTYIGGGIIFGIDHHEKHRDDTELVLGVRMPVGLEYRLPGKAIQFFGEIAPGLQLVNETDFILQIGIGARFLIP